MLLSIPYDIETKLGELLAVVAVMATATETHGY